jgi:peptide/nickel transport system ATP-binding protein/oligopeptide transport system ATP-binding protein
VDVDFHAARSLSGPCVFGEDHAQTGTPEWHPLSPTHGISCRFHPPQA